MYKVPIDLEKYGFSESLVNALDDENLKAIVALDVNAINVYDQALKAREDYLESEYDKVRASYSIKNFPNEYTAPGGDGFKMGVGLGFGKSLVFLGAGLLAGALIF